MIGTLPIGVTPVGVPGGDAAIFGTVTASVRVTVVDDSYGAAGTPSNATRVSVVDDSYGASGTAAASVRVIVVSDA